MGDENRNDYDSIAERLEKIMAVVWAAGIVAGRDESDPTKNLVYPALQESTRNLNELIEWIKGLAETHRGFV